MKLIFSNYITDAETPPSPPPTSSKPTSISTNQAHPITVNRSRIFPPASSQGTSHSSLSKTTNSISDTSSSSSVSLSNESATTNSTVNSSKTSSLSSAINAPVTSGDKKPSSSPPRQSIIGGPRKKSLSPQPPPNEGDKTKKLSNGSIDSGMSVSKKQNSVELSNGELHSLEERITSVYNQLFPKVIYNFIYLFLLYINYCDYLQFI